MFMNRGSHDESPTQSADPVSPGGVHYAFFAVLIAAGAATCIVLSGLQLSQTYDEPAHVASGLEWLQSGSYELSQENPPIARIAAAIGPALAGARLPATGIGRERGTEILYAGSHYRRNLALARLGVLPFFGLAVLAVWLWTRRIATPRAAMLAVAALCTLASFLAHAGLATTDVAFAASLALALYAVVLVVDRPTSRRGIFLGAAFGLAIATKFSAFVFLPTAALGIVALTRFAQRRAETRNGTPSAKSVFATLTLAGLVCFAVTWSAYQFSFGRPADEPLAERWIATCAPDGSGIVQRSLRAVFEIPLPAPEMLNGVVMLCAHNAGGHPSYLLGRNATAGTWTFYPIALGVKTPLPFALLVIVGMMAGWRAVSRARDPRLLAPVAASLAIVGVAMSSNLNIGSRHIIAVYPLLAIVAGVGAERLWMSSAHRLVGRAVLVVLLAFQLVGLGRSYPDFIGHFNPLAGDDPGEWLVDSDLDWGQGVVLLESFFRGRDAEVLHIAYWGTARLCEHELPRLEWLQSGEPVSGWIAISETYRQGRANKMRPDPCSRVGRRVRNAREGYAWLADHEPVARLGGSIRVYYIDPE